MPKWGEPEDAQTISQRLGFSLTTDNLCTYKALFGDPSDNIPPILTGKHKEQFIELLTELQPISSLDFLLKALEGMHHPILEIIKQHERQYRINLQLVQAIAVGDSHIENTLTTGRQATKIIEALDLVLGIKEEQSGFVFGNVKRPRV
jgi:5'-3' exonuclease